MDIDDFLSDDYDDAADVSVDYLARQDFYNTVGDCEVIFTGRYNCERDFFETDGLSDKVASLVTELHTEYVDGEVFRITIDASASDWVTLSFQRADRWEVVVTHDRGCFTKSYRT